jgi:hypothetical protein
MKKDIDKAIEYYDRPCDLKEPKWCENYVKLKE